MKPWTSLLLLPVMCIACAGSSNYMRTGEGRPQAPPPGMALLFILRPSGFGAGVDFQVWDGDRCIGVSVSKKAFSYACTPGKHFFMFLAENNSAIEAELRAGLTYYVVLSAKMGWWKARVAAHPITRDSEYWEDAPVWAQETIYEEPIPELIAEWEASHRERAMQIMATLRSPEGQKYVAHLPSEAGR